MHGSRAGHRGAVAALWFLLAGCGRGSPTLTVGCKDFTEQLILGQLTARHVESRLPAVRVVRKLNLGGTLVCFSALRNGNIDLYPDYTGTILSTILKEPLPPERGAFLSRARTVLAERYGIVCLPPFGFDNTYALMMRAKDARSLGIRTISDLRPHAGRLLAGFTSEFLERGDGHAGLARAYGFRFVRAPLQMSSGLMYGALKDGQVQVISGFSTDGRVEAFHLTVLEDDRHFFPPYQACLLVRREALQRFAGLDEALRELSGTLNDATMRSLNAAVDLNGRTPAVVAEEYLRHRRLLR